MNFIYSSNGRHLTEQFEGDVLHAYWDARGERWSIGYGHTGIDVYEGLIWSQEQADQALQHDLAWASRVVNALVSFPINQGEFDSLVDFVHNEGAGNFAHSTMLELLNKGAIREAANEFEKWCNAGGVKMAGLLRRRLAEKREFQGA